MLMKKPLSGGSLHESKKEFCMSETSSSSYSIQKLLAELIEKDGSDLHISSDSPPRMRIMGKLDSVDGPGLNNVETKKLCYSIITDQQRQQFEEENELDFSFGIKGLSRFRANLFIQRGAVAGVFRSIPYRIMTFKELGITPVVADLCKKPRGLILVTGPTGSGKSTTLASMVDSINKERYEHIVTIEDPIEYLHSSQRALVNQREVGYDTQSYGKALKYILRQDPDVVLLGELRDTETIDAALRIAETGHLCLATLHTNSCMQTINRVVDVFPAQQQQQARTQLSFVLEGVISQLLLPKANGHGRALAMEVMIPNSAIRNLIREDKIHQIYSQMQVGQAKFGMMTLNQSLLNLYMSREISLEEAVGRSQEPEELRQMLKASGTIGLGGSMRRGV